MTVVKVDCALDIKSANDQGYVEGLGSVFGNVDLGFDRIEKGAFKDTLRTNRSLPMLWQHRDDQPIGVWNSLKETDVGLHVKGQINLEVNQGREARALAAQGAVKGLSIGYIPRDYEYEDDVRVIKRADLWEVSLVTFPMNQLALMTSVKNMSRKELETWLREELGLSRYLASSAAYAIRKAIRDERPDSGDDELVASIANLNAKLRARLK